MVISVTCIPVALAPLKTHVTVYSYVFNRSVTRKPSIDLCYMYI